MSSCKTSIVSILNNDDNPSFAVRSAPRLSRSQSSPYHHSEQLPPPATDPQHTRTQASSESPATSPRGTRRRLDTVTEVIPVSPGSSDGSTYDYITSQSSAYHPYARQDPGRDPRRDLYRFPGRGPAPQTPPDTRSSTSETVSSQTGPTRGTGRKNKYPCPYATSHGCSATFTTSGHAARHGKKHTGEKSVHCPICNKAFTRKDNMKQHIRTHRTHSDDMRSTSEPEADARWAMARPDSAYASASHQRNISQHTETAVRPPPGAGPQAT